MVFEEKPSSMIIDMVDDVDAYSNPSTFSLNIQEFDNLTLTSAMTSLSSITDSTTLVGDKAVISNHLSLLDQKIMKMAEKRRRVMLKKARSEEETAQKALALKTLDCDTSKIQ